MKSSRRGMWLVALLAAVSAEPIHASTRAHALERDFSTVGRIVSRLVEGRTIVVIPVSGPLRAHLSEPIRVGNHWRLTVTIEDARMAIRGTGVKNPEGVVSLSAGEVGSDVRVTVDVRALGDYGARHSEEGYLLWVDPKPKPVEIAAGTPLGTEPTMSGRRQEHEPEPARDGRGSSSGSLLLIVLAAGAGLAVRHVRRNGVPAWADPWMDRLPASLRDRLTGSAGKERRGAGRMDTVRPMAGRDPRGRSAEIGDAFRIEPEKPASGIAALGTASGSQDR